MNKQSSIAPLSPGLSRYIKSREREKEREKRGDIAFDPHEIFVFKILRLKIYLEKKEYIFVSSFTTGLEI